MIRASVANPHEYELDFQRLKAAAVAVLEGEGVREAKVTLAFVDTAHIHRLNKQFLDHDEPTDVITFPYTAAGAKKLEGEHAYCRLPESLLVPLPELPSRVEEVQPPAGALVVVYCHHGVRSLRGAALLRQAGHENVASLAGGIDAWSLMVDPAVPRY